MADSFADRAFGAASGLSFAGAAASGLPWIAMFALLFLWVVHSLLLPLFRGWAHARYGPAAVVNRNTIKLYDAGITGEELLRHAEIQARSEGASPDGLNPELTAPRVKTSLLRRGDLVRHLGGYRTP